MREALSRFWSGGVWQQIAEVIGALLLCGICALAVGGAVVGIGLLMPLSRTSSGVIYETTVTVAPTPTLLPSGPPKLGAPVADFNAAYGPIVSHGAGGSDNWWADKEQTTLVTVTFMGEAASTISVAGPNTWTKAQTMKYCTMFLPVGASEYDQAPPYTDYHSPLGNLLLDTVGPGHCMLFFTIP